VTLALIAWHTKIVLPLQALRLLSLSFSQRHCICARVCVYVCVERVYVWRGSHVLSSLCQGYEMSVQGCWRYLPHSHNTNTHTAELSSGSHTHTHTDQSMWNRHLYPSSPAGSIFWCGATYTLLC